jgi:hypothetical protein
MNIIYHNAHMCDMPNGTMSMTFASYWVITLYVNRINRTWATEWCTELFFKSLLQNNHVQYTDKKVFLMYIFTHTDLDIL